MNIEEFRKFAEDNFWVTDKRGQDVKFHLWESQEILLNAIQKASLEGKRGVLVGLNRQIGCSSALSALAFYTALTTAHQNIVIAESDYEMASMKLLAMDATAEKLTSVTRERDGFVVQSPDGAPVDSNSRVTITTEPQIQKLRGIRTGITLLVIESVNRWKESSIERLLDIAKSAFVVMVMLPSPGSASNKIWEEYGPEWDRVFIPWYAEKTRQSPPPEGWEPQEYEAKMAARVKVKSGVDLSNAQLYWHQRRRTNLGSDEQSIRLMQQEFATTFHETASAE